MNFFRVAQFNSDELVNLFSHVEVNESNVSTLPSSKSYFRKSIEAFFSNPVAVGSIILLAIVIVLIVVSIFVCPYSYKDIIEVHGMRDATALNLSPMQYSQLELEAIANGEKIFPHIFGTDSICRDYFARVMMGSILSLAIGLIASILVIIIGTIYGSIAGFFGGRVDMVMMRIVDIIYSLPDMLIIILLSVMLRATLPLSSKGMMGIFGPNIISMFLVFSLLYWVSMARTVRGQILTIRKKDYITSLKIIGASNRRIIFTHIIPNCLSVIFIAVALHIPSAIFTESYLSFVGLGVEEPMPSLGSLASSALQEIDTNTYKIIFPSIIIVCIVLSFNLIGNALRDAFDPKVK